MGQPPKGMGLVVRQANGQDARVSEAAITKRDRVMTRALDGARVKILTTPFAGWDKQEVAELTRLLRRFADDALKFVRTDRFGSG